MAVNNQNPFSFKPIILDQDKYSKRRVIRQLPTVHQTETLQKFFGASVDHLFDAGTAKPINGYVGQRPLWLNPDQDYYINEPTTERAFYQLEPSMVSRAEDVSITNLLFYPDLINQIRFQGGNVDNHTRMFEQEFYSWCPPINLDMNINFRQYYWLEEGPPAVSTWGPKTDIMLGDGLTTTFALPAGEGTLYKYEDIKPSEIRVIVDERVLTYSTVGGVLDTFTYDTTTHLVDIFPVPPLDSEVQIWVYSDVSNNVLGRNLNDAGVKAEVTQALGGITPSSGMKIKLFNDINPAYSDKTFIFENVGSSIMMILDENAVDPDSLIDNRDYITIARGCRDGNQWSTRNRWFHRDVVNNPFIAKEDALSPEALQLAQATRPIVEYIRDLELFNYGRFYRGAVHILVDGALNVPPITNLVNYVNQNPTSMVLDGLTLTPGPNNTVTIDGIDYPSVRILATNTLDPLINDRIYAILNKNGIMKIALESDGQDASGSPVNGESTNVLLGSSAGFAMFYDGVEWIQGQTKGEIKTGPLFQLYDMNDVSLADPGIYPKSNFAGSRLFSYEFDDNSSRPIDPVLGFSVIHDSKGQIKFKNYTATERYTYVENNDTLEIKGLYFNKVTALSSDNDQLSNDWYVTNYNSRQMMVDQYIADGVNIVFKISQEPAEQDPVTPENLQVVRGRVNSNSDFEKTKLIEGVDFARRGLEILIFDSVKDDIYDIKTYNPATPGEHTGFYEVPLNLHANPLTEEIGSVAKGDFFEQFAEIIRSQKDFVGAEYASNNWRDTQQERNLGNQIVQNSASLLKTMLLGSEDQLDIMGAMRFVEAEYARFRAKFEQKITDFWFPAGNGQTQLTVNDSIDTWIDTALKEINRGKTKDFPFYNSGVGLSTLHTVPTFIPATPSYLGVFPLYVPEIVEDTTNDAGNRYIIGHDGSMTLCYQNSDDFMDPRDQVILALEIRIFNSVADNIRTRERPIFDWQTAFGNKFQTGDYSYKEYIQMLRPSFERWNAANGLDYHTNDLAAVYSTYQALNAKKITDPAWDPVADQAALDAAIAQLDNPWDWNWSSVLDQQGERLPGHWRGIYELYFGTDRPHTHPWEMLGFTSEPTWWASRYGEGPYSSDNHVLWDDLEFGVIFDGPRKGTDVNWARPGLTGRYDIDGNLLTTPVDGYIPADHVGELLHPGPRADGGCGIAATIPLYEYAAVDWKWGDRSPVESAWYRSVHFPFAAAQAGYLMKPARFVEYGWDSANLVTLFPGTPREQMINQDTMTRAVNANLQVHGEINADYTAVTKIGVQQWVSDLLASRNLNITTNFGNKVRGLSAQLAYKVAGFTDSSNLFVVSDSFDRVPVEDVSTSLYKSPSIREEFYSGVIVERSPGGWSVFGYDVLNPNFTIMPGDPNAAQLSVGTGLTAAPVPTWRAGVNYSVNFVVSYADKYYRATRTHTSISTFETTYWTQIARPQYADGSALLWNLDNTTTGQTTKVAYGTFYDTPQGIADFLNGYQRYLVTRGWVFDHLNPDNLDVEDWRTALANFITWSQTDIEDGDFIALSPSNEQVKFVTDNGTIQPIERIINGVYAIIDRVGNPIQPNDTSVQRTDGEVLITPHDTVGGIFGLRLYISEVEHVIVLNNTTIFNDIIYSPLLNIRQPRLRLQGFKTRNWKGRIDAPGFIVTGNTLIPNFEKTADDFRHYFDIESIESTELQARARANVGYEEREYLNNLLLTPTNQFELYQGMIQQKGTPTAMRRLLRSNFIRHNKGLKFFEEWAFRVGDYGSSEVRPIMVLKLNQKDIKNNPQLIEFHSEINAPSTTEENKVIVTDIFDAEGVIVNRDDRWVWRPDMQEIAWPAFKEKPYEKGNLPRAGYVNVDEVSFYLKNEADFATLLDIKFDATAAQNKRIWNYGFDSGDWATYRFAKTDQNIVSLTAPSVAGMAAVIALDSNLVQGTVLPKRNRDTNYVSGDLEVVNNRIILRDFNEAQNTPLGEIYRPAIQNSMSLDLTNISQEISYLMDAVAVAGLVIEGFDITVSEAFAEGASLTLGTEEEGLEELFLERPEDPENLEPDYTDRASKPVETYVTNRTYEIHEDDTTVDIQIVRVGQFDVDLCNPTYVDVTWTYLDVNGVPTGVETVERLTFDPAHQVNDGTSTYQTISVPVPTGQGATSIGVRSEIVNEDGSLITPLDQYQHIADPMPTEINQFRTVPVVRPSGSGRLVIDLTQVGTTSTDLASAPGTYPYDFYADRIDDLMALNDITIQEATAIAILPTRLIATLRNEGSLTGKVSIKARYHYTKGFELFSNESVPTPITTDEHHTGGKIFGLIPARFTTEVETQDMPGLHAGLVEIDKYQATDGWAVLDSALAPIREENSRVQSKQISSAAIYVESTNELRQVLQLFDPVKGFIPGVADRELSYKLDYDPADYNRTSDDTVTLDENTEWGKEQVGKLWWDLSTTRYLDYEINDDISGGTEYRWKHWGKLAPTIEIEIYEWTRSTVHPVDWADQVKKYQDVSVIADTDKPTGEVKNFETPNWVERLEWNDELQRDDVIYYFWVKDVATVPAVGGREFSAVQVAGIIQDPMANDIPYVAIIDTNKIIVGSTNQYLNDIDSVLKVSWNLTDGSNDAYDGLHHKQWAILREGDERNTINPRMWNKMRDSLVGFDTNQDLTPSITTLVTGFTDDDAQQANFTLTLDSTAGFLAQGSATIAAGPDVGYLWISYEWVDYASNTLHNVTVNNVEFFQDIPAGQAVTQDHAVDDFGTVPDPQLSDSESLGNMIRPRQSWFPADIVTPAGIVTPAVKRPGRAARQLFVDAFNKILSVQPFVDQWFDWQAVFETGTPAPAESEYAFEVFDLTELLALPTLPNPIEPGQLAYIASTTEARGFWTLWRWTGTEFLLERAQDYRMQEGELWQFADWYADGWSAADFPIYRFKNYAERNAAAPLDVTLMKGTLVQVDQQSDTDPRWSWHVYTSTGWTDVAKQSGTIALKDNFYKAENTLFTPVKGTTVSEVQATYADAVLMRDGTWELKWLLDTIQIDLFTKLQANELFFSMVKSALGLNQDTDWVFKTSFLYLGGYSEILKQNPVSTADQIDNVIAYIEEVKPYHVRVRDYVRRLSYGPDLAKCHMTDFDKPVYVEGTGPTRTSRVLQLDGAADENILATTLPWKDWYDNYQKTNYDLKNWDEEWNPIRRFYTRVQMDRIACVSTNGWDNVEVPWDASQIRYHNPVVHDVAADLDLYRDAVIAPGDLNPYKDVTVADMDERNQLVRDRVVVRGTIATVLGMDPTWWIWTETEWKQIWGTQWDGNWFNGAIDRVQELYKPNPGMKQLDSNNLISGCGFRGTFQDGDNFEHGMYDQFAWDYQGQGWADEFEFYAGLDIELNPDNTFDEPAVDPTAIDIDGAEFDNFDLGEGHPEELVRLKNKDPLTITVYEQGTTPLAYRVHKNGFNKWEKVRLDEQSVVTGAWDPATRSLAITAGSAAFPFHDPNNPSKEFLDAVRIGQGYRATKSANDFALGLKTFKLSDWNTNKRMKTLPVDLMPKAGQVVEVIIEEPGNSTVRMVGEVQFSGDLAAWLASKTLSINITGYVGDSSSLPAGPIDDWNIMPKRAFNQLGAIWVGKERMTYTTVTGSGPDFTLGGVRRGTATTFADDIVAGTSVYDASILKRFPAAITGVHASERAFLEKSDGGPTR